MVRALRTLTCIAVLGGAAALSLLRLSPPASDDPAGGFSTARAMAHVRAVAREPHPSGSEAADRVRDYVVQQFEQLGLETRVAETPVDVPEGFRGPALTAVRNVVARLPGSAGLNGDGEAVMLATHYDSARVAPGAGDAGVAVAALLEVARVLSAQPVRPRRDVVFLITDAEERGLVGARAFVRHDPWRNRPGVVFNFEGRGTSGPSVMFETSDGNAWLVGQYARAVSNPVTTSLAPAVYERMPNGTDFSVFRSAGVGGLGFAFIGSYVHYHTPRDDAEHLSARSVRHHGQQALALARHFASLESLEPVHGRGNAVFFDVLALGVVRYPGWLAVPLALGAVTFWFGVVTWGVRRGRVSPGGVTAGAVLSLVWTAAACGWCYVLVASLGAPRLDQQSDLATGTMVAIAVACWLIAIAPTRRTLSAGSATAGALVPWVVGAIGTAITEPGGSYLFVWPLVFATVGLLLVLRSPGATSTQVGVLALAVPGVVMLSPAIYLFFQAMMMQGAFVVVAMPALLLGTLVAPLRLAWAGSGNPTRDVASVVLAAGEREGQVIPQEA